jgi:uncharacterized protein YjbJ (UPF0337 family)
MDKDRIEGIPSQVKGSKKAEGRRIKAAGKVQNTVGGTSTRFATP